MVLFEQGVNLFMSQIDFFFFRLVTNFCSDVSRVALFQETKKQKHFNPFLRSLMTA